MIDDEKWINEYMELINDPRHIDKLSCICYSKEYMDNYIKQINNYKKSD